MRTIGKVLAGAAVVAAAAVTGVLAAPDRGGEPDLRLLQAAGEAAEATDEGARLVALLERGRSHTFHARYVVRSQDPQVKGATVALEVWRRPPQVRMDSTLVVDDREVRTAAVRQAEAGALQLCEKERTGPWTCRETHQEAAGFDDLLQQVKEALKFATVEQQTGVVRGRAASCWSLQDAEGSLEVCLDDNGVPLRIGQPGATIEAINVTRSVRDADFRLP